MKRKELGKLRTKTIEELVKDEAKMRLDIEKGILDKYAGKEKNVRKVKNMRHELAQILTIKSELERKNTK